MAWAVGKLCGSCAGPVETCCSARGHRRSVKPSALGSVATTAQRRPAEPILTPVASPGDLSDRCPVDLTGPRPAGVSSQHSRRGLATCALPWPGTATRSVSGCPARERARSQCLIGQRVGRDRQGEGSAVPQFGAVLRALRHEFVTVTGGGCTGCRTAWASGTAGCARLSPTCETASGRRSGSSTSTGIRRSVWSRR